MCIRDRYSERSKMPRAAPLRGSTATLAVVHTLRSYDLSQERRREAAHSRCNPSLRDSLVYYSPLTSVSSVASAWVRIADSANMLSQIETWRTIVLPERFAKVVKCTTCRDHFFLGCCCRRRYTLVNCSAMATVNHACTMLRGHSEWS